MLDRKLALLQASAVIFSQLWEHRNVDMMSEEDLMKSSVAMARALLLEIEKQETEPLSSQVPPDEMDPGMKV